MNKQTLVPIGILLAIVVVGLIMLFMFYPKNRFANGELDGFAKCLAEKNITMYGAAWCPHCQNEKWAFGDSFRFVPYVECPDNPNKCLAADVDGYPTWIFPDGRKLVGEQGIKKLSRESGCVLIQAGISN